MSKTDMNQLLRRAAGRPATAEEVQNAMKGQEPTPGGTGSADGGAGQSNAPASVDMNTLLRQARGQYSRP